MVGDSHHICATISVTCLVVKSLLWVEAFVARDSDYFDYFSSDSTQRTSQYHEHQSIGVRLLVRHQLDFSIFDGIHAVVSSKWLRLFSTFPLVPQTFCKPMKVIGFFRKKARAQGRVLSDTAT